MSSLLRVRLLLLSLLAINLSCRATPPPVYDTDGHELRADAGYYVLPANPGRGGGLTLAPNGPPCPLFVAQEASEHREGFPVRFIPHGGGAAAPPSPSDRTVRLSTDVRIRFEAFTTCVQSTEWHIGSELMSGRRHVITGPVADPSPSGRENAFRIEKYSGAELHEYKLMSCRDSCQDLGVFRDHKGTWFMGATEPVHVVVFKKARTSV